MSNEELVERIQSGERDRLGELWAQVEQFVWRQANRRPDTPAVDREDLHQSGYLALVEAVDSYDPAAGMSFIGWFALFLKTAFNEASNYRTRRQRLDPMHEATSLDRPLDDEDGGKLLDLIADPTAGMEDVEDEIWAEELHAALEEALSRLTIIQSDTLRRRYYRGQSAAKVADETGATLYEIRRAERQGLDTLRRKAGPQLRAFVEDMTPYYAHVGVKQFTATHTSAVEKCVIEREKLLKGWEL